MDKKQLTISIIAGVVVLLVGIGLGMLLNQQTKTQVQKVQAATSLSSKVISSITAYGKVASVQGNNITLSSLGDTLSVVMTTNARVFSFTIPTTTDKNGKVTTGTPVQQQASLSNIKIGDNVNVVMKLSPDGQMQGSSIIILPVTAK